MFVEDADEQRRALSAKRRRAARQQPQYREDPEHAEQVGVAGRHRVPGASLFDDRRPVRGDARLLDGQHVVVLCGHREDDRERRNDRQQRDVSTGDVLVASGVLKREQNPRDRHDHDAGPAGLRPPDHARRVARREAEDDARRPPRLADQQPHERGRARLRTVSPRENRRAASDGDRPEEQQYGDRRRGEHRYL